MSASVEQRFPSFSWLTEAAGWSVSATMLQEVCGRAHTLRAEPGLGYTLQSVLTTVGRPRAKLFMIDLMQILLDAAVCSSGGKSPYLPPVSLYCSGPIDPGKSKSRRTQEHAQPRVTPLWKTSHEITEKDYKRKKVNQRIVSLLLFNNR